MTTKTNAARILDRAKIKYELAEYEVDETDLSATHVAESVGVSVSKLFKTLVARGDKTGVIVGCIPGDKELDLKAIASASGNKKVAMVAMKEIQELTGYIRGGCSPLGMKKNYPFFLDQSAFEHDLIYISAGVRGKQLILSPQDLLSVTRGTLVDICESV